MSETNSEHACIQFVPTTTKTVKGRQVVALLPVYTTINFVCAYYFAIPQRAGRKTNKNIITSFKVDDSYLYAHSSFMVNIPRDKKPGTTARYKQQ